MTAPPDAPDALAPPTRAVITAVTLVGVGACAALAWAVWSVLALLGDPHLWFIGLFALGGAAWAGIHLAPTLPALLEFYRAFASADPSSYYGGFVPAAGLLAPSFVIAVVGGRASLWVPPTAVGLAIIGLLLLPATRRDFGQS